MTYTQTLTRRTRSDRIDYVFLAHWGGLFALLFAKGAELVTTLAGLEIGLVEANLITSIIAYVEIWLLVIAISIGVVLALIFMTELTARIMKAVTFGDRRAILKVYLVGYWFPSLLWLAAAAWNTNLILGVLG